MHWTATRNAPYASWILTLPWPTTASDLDSLLNLAATVLQVGRAERVFDVLETRQPEGFLAERDGPYEEFLARNLAKTGRLRLLTSGLAASPGRI